MPAGLAAAQWAVHAETPEMYDVPAELGRHVIDLAAGAVLDGVSMRDYIPAYRSVAGMGVSMPFAVWN